MRYPVLPLCAVGLFAGVFFASAATAAPQEDEVTQYRCQEADKEGRTDKVTKKVEFETCRLQSEGTIGGVSVIVPAASKSREKVWVCAEEQISANKESGEVERITGKKCKVVTERAATGVTVHPPTRRR
ncbi:hypothetical protein DFR70_102340 [Nocardia tenerifensis]|uniref:Uncharacterized protein n=1 Tax=Nocardia tenerifensis TaxID=228006 RepID=A0A318KAY6_9NOCA|nr:hypothetical protein [Nocardia tenerifensis]PXX68656.1 hypothetical protein DFR70_102340 [Nocardia tenerifensis]